MPLFTALLRDRAPIAWPNTCAVCHAASHCRSGRACTSCIARWAPLRPRCRQCALPVPAGVERCGVCVKDAPPFVATVAAADYGYPWDGLLHAYKFRDALDLAPALAMLVQRAWLAANPPAVDHLLPVPLAPVRLRERGYNQAGVLARQLAKLVERPAACHALLRAIDTPPQAELGRAERLSSLRGAFAVEPSWAMRLRGSHVAVIDDVMTTGATLHEIALTLQHAGVASVQAWVVARTPSR